MPSQDTTSKTPVSITKTVRRLDGNKLRIDYNGVNKLNKIVSIEVIFAGSENFRVVPYLDPLVRNFPMAEKTAMGEVAFGFGSTLNAQTSVYLGYVERIDDSKRSALRSDIKWKYVTFQTPLEESNYIIGNQQYIRDLMIKATNVRFPQSYHDLDATITNGLCNEYSMKYIDLDFPPITSSIVRHISNGRISDEGSQFGNPVWKRPSEFISNGKEIKIFDGISPMDIIQGDVGNCWYISALAALAEFPSLVRELFAEHSRTYNPNGVYDLHFYKNGFSTIVRVDDLFPCFPGEGNGPMMSRCNGNELWVMLAEKAFAKLHGSYTALVAGRTAEALMDLTGAPYQQFDFTDPRSPELLNTWWEKLLEYDNCNYIITAEMLAITQPKRHDMQAITDVQELSNRARRALFSGILPGHAYSLVSCVTLQNGSIRLCQLHNPWSGMEWTGDWSDSSSKWTEKLKAELKAIMDKRRETSDIEDRTIAGCTNRNDGLFWMSFEDLAQYCFLINVSFVRHPKYCPRNQGFIEWNVQRRKFYFDFDHNQIAHKDAVGASRYGNILVVQPRNPLFQLNVEEPGHFLISLHQEDMRIVTAKPYIFIGLGIYQYVTDGINVDANNEAAVRDLRPMLMMELRNERQRCTDHLYLPRGKYVIAPIASGDEYYASWLQQHHDPRNEGNPENAVTPFARMSKRIDPNLVTAPSLINPAQPISPHTPLVETNVATNELYFSKSVLAALEEIFEHLDLDNTKRIEKREYDHFLYRLGKPPSTDDDFAWNIREFEPTEANKPLHLQGLFCAGFIKLQWFEFEKSGKNENLLLINFKKLGFDNQLVLIDGHQCGLVVHSSSSKYILKGLPYPDIAIEQAIKLADQNQLGQRR